MTGFKRAGRLVLVVVILAGVHTQLSQAATFTVTTGTDGGPGSLRQAIIDADGLGGASGALGAGHPTISGGFAACGAPRFSGDVRFDGGGIQNHGSSLSLDHVTVSGNFACGGGGGIANDTFGSASIVASTISGNSAYK